MKSSVSINSCYLGPLSNSKTHHRVNQLDTIVVRGIVTGRDHNTNPLSTELLGPESCKQSHCEHHCIEKVPVGMDIGVGPSVLQIGI